MADDAFNLRIELGLDVDADAEQLEETTRLLRAELLELDVESVERPSGGEIPEGAKAVDPISIGALVVTLSSRAITAVAGVLQGWLARRSGRSVKLVLGQDSIEITGGSKGYQREMIETFLAAHVIG